MLGQTRMISPLFKPFAYWGIFCDDFFQNKLFSKNSSRNTISVSNSLGPDQARRFVGPDLGPNCLQRLSADDTSIQRANLKQNT